MNYRSQGKSTFLGFGNSFEGKRKSPDPTHWTWALEGRWGQHYTIQIQRKKLIFTVTHHSKAYPAL